jgi:hypothetical protein
MSVLSYEGTSATTKRLPWAGLVVGILLSAVVLVLRRH